MIPTVSPSATSWFFAMCCILACGRPSMAPQSPLDFVVPPDRFSKVPQEDWGEIQRLQAELAAKRQKTEQARLAITDGARRTEIAKQKAKQSEQRYSEADTQKRAAAGAQQRNSATKNAYLALMAKKAAEERLRYVEARVKELELRHNWARSEELAHEARIEEAKARLLKKHRLESPNVIQVNFQVQRAQRSRAAQRARYLADKQMEAAQQRKNVWKQSEQRAQAANATSGIKLDPPQ